MTPLKPVLYLVGIIATAVIFTYQESRLPIHSVLFVADNSLYDVMKRDGSFSNNFIFKLVDNLPQLKTHIKTGEYLLDRRENVYLFLSKLLCGNYIRRKITFREGLTVWQIIDQLNKEPLLSGVISETPAEGSLMPDTYYYKFGDTRQNIINKMRDEMNKFKGQVFKSNRTNLSWNEIVTLGSLIEMEAGTGKDRPIISSVLHNRLKNGMRLQCDTAIIYALTVNGKYTGSVNRTTITHKDLWAETQYNTYRHKGLPPGAICCPSRDSILAAMHPRQTKYLYFIADVRTKKIYYSETFQQHVKNKVMLKKRYETVN